MEVQKRRVLTAREFKAVKERVDEAYRLLKEEGYNEREGQVIMTDEILLGLREGKCVFVEAGVGIGKTFAYLIPALTISKELEKPVLVASSTNNLKNQIKRDVEVLRKILNNSTPVISIEGESNYSCKEKELLEEYPATVTYSPYSCPSCKYPCDYRDIRESLVDFRGIILTNQNLLLHDLRLKQEKKISVFPQNILFSVIDEGHHFGAKMREEGYKRFRKEEVLYHLDRSRQRGGKAGKLETLTKRAFDIWRGKDGEISGVKEAPALTLHTYLSMYPQKDEFLCDFLETLEHVVTKEYFCWVEDDTLYEDVSKKELSSPYPLIITSATITEEKEDPYAYISRETGIKTPKKVTPIPSPYAYDKHSRLYVASDMPHPTTDSTMYRYDALEKIKRLTEIPKKSMILFTAKKDLQFFSKRLENTFVDVEEFSKAREGILLTTAWEGIDTHVSLVIIYRLPFKAPDVLLEHQMEQMKKEGRNPVKDYLVPEMLRTLRQGVGRLIRHEDDYGVVAVIDSRLVNVENYYQAAKDLLPMNVWVEDIEEAEEFLKEC